MRDRIGGTDALEGDFDRWKLAERYDPAYEGIERLGDFVAHRLKLTAKPALVVPFAMLRLCAGTNTGTALKIEGLAVSGSAARPSYHR